MRTLVVFVSRKLDSRIPAPSRFVQDAVQEDSTDTLSPPVGEHVDEVEVASSGYERTRPGVVASGHGQRHPDRLSSVFRDEEPRNRVAKVIGDLLHALCRYGAAVPPNQVRPQVDR